MSSSNSRSEHFSLNTSQLSESNEDDNNRDVLERTEDDEDDSFHPELEEDELSTNARTLIEFSQQIASASEAGCSTQSVSEELVDLQRLRRTQKIFKELQFNNPGRQLVESLSTDGLTEYATNRPKRNKNRNKTTNEESSRNTNKSSNYTGKLFHNQKGHLTTSRGAVDLCDCLDLECSGFFDCFGGVDCNKTREPLSVRNVVHKNAVILAETIDAPILKVLMNWDLVVQKIRFFDQQENC
uniref:ARF7 effector protein C-terminal domain-containing protein n=1 Tax=Meloidogyne javanica TaxID=6303 RepID=A0A915N8Y0_MELJA